MDIFIIFLKSLRNLNIFEDVKIFRTFISGWVICQCFSSTGHLLRTQILIQEI